jgi:hypothetical protein
MAGDFADALDDLEGKVHAALFTGVGEATDDLKRTSQDLVPFDQADLSNSAEAHVTEGTGGVEGTVTYDTPYAARQHEEHTWQHDPGRTSNYLGGPLRTGATRYEKHIADAVRDVLG